MATFQEMIQGLKTGAIWSRYAWIGYFGQPTTVIRRGVVKPDLIIDYHSKPFSGVAYDGPGIYKLTFSDLECIDWFEVHSMKDDIKIDAAIQEWRTANPQYNQVLIQKKGEVS